MTIYKTEQEVVSQICNLFNINCCQSKEVLSDCRERCYSRRQGWNLLKLNQYFVELEKYGAEHIEIK